MTMIDFQIGECQYSVGAEIGWFLYGKLQRTDVDLGKSLVKLPFLE